MWTRKIPSSPTNAISPDCGNWRASPNCPCSIAARTSTGTGISYMQMELAWRDGVLIPEQKAEPEDPKSPDELLVADRGGLVFTPKIGFHANVAELDFVSEYPSIMARFNISPETVNCPCCPDAPRVPELGYRVCQSASRHHQPRGRAPHRQAHRIEEV